MFLDAEEDVTLALPPLPPLLFLPDDLAAAAALFLAIAEICGESVDCGDEIDGGYVFTPKIKSSVD